MPAIANEENPFRVAVVGSGPSGFYAAEALLRRPNVCVDMFDRLPTLNIILGHMGGYFHVDEAIDAAERHANLVLETSAMPYPVKIREAVERVGAERVLYASTIQRPESG